MYDLSREGLDTILFTVGRRFRQARLFNTVGQDMLLVTGPAIRQVNLAQMQTRMAQPKVKDDLRRVTKTGAPLEFRALLQHEIIGPSRFRSRWSNTDFGMIAHTDRFPRIQYLAARSFYTGRGTNYLNFADERLEPRAGNGLMIAEFLGAQVVTDADIASVLSYQNQWRRGVSAGLNDALRQVQYSRGLQEKVGVIEEEDCARAVDMSRRRIELETTVYTKAEPGLSHAIVKTCTGKVAPRALRVLKRMMRLGGVHTKGEGD